MKTTSPLALVSFSFLLHSLFVYLFRLPLKKESFQYKCPDLEKNLFLIKLAKPIKKPNNAYQQS